jgi:hypothetical protein
MLAAAAARLETGRYDAESKVLFIEAMLVHVRLLANFLIGPIETSDRDIQRTDFTGEWTPDPPNALKLINQHYPAIDKHLAHLSWTRVTAGTPGWPTNLANATLLVASRWAEHLRQTDPQLGTVVAQHVRAARAMLKPPPFSGLLVVRTN